MFKDRHNGLVLKAVTGSIGEREISFYENMTHVSSDPSIKALRNLVPAYRGTVELPVCGQNVVFIKLADLTHMMSKPCVIDIKMGKRTWDPLATPETIRKEDKRFNVTKQIYGFGVSGIRVFDIKTDEIKQFGRDYAESLDQNSVKDGEIWHEFIILHYLNILSILAFKIFLNADTQLSKQLVTAFLALLRPIQEWAQTQTTLRLYASSVMLTYDAQQLENQIFCENHSTSQNINSSSSYEFNLGSLKNNNTLQEKLKQIESTQNDDREVSLANIK